MDEDNSWLKHQLQHANQELDEMRDALETAYRRSLDLELKWKNAPVPLPPFELNVPSAFGRLSNELGQRQ
ncbi:hypothetical protein NDU88_007241 [Pleurodeles waltl]|uniref:Uncharacterized protein n=1 Tax=Pleurodeles waltl TaxID=8319 RepID=A0AAV7RTH8_PLEWA|nr:hypothetical protein NDU88_007241 [Pleurodeles waltl]